MKAPNNRDVTRTASLAGAVAAAVAASACCIGPLILAVLGIGGAGFLVALEPYRPVFTIVTLGLLGAGWYLTYREPARAPATPSVMGPVGADGDDCGCEMPKANRAGKRMLWVATGLVGVALAFPYLTPYLF
jgi:mercuric ion transport protein